MDTKGTANAYLIAALMLGALLPIALKFASGLNTYYFLFLAYVLSVPVSFMFVLQSGNLAKLVSYVRNPRSLALIAFIGLLNYAVLEFGLTYAENFVSASLATVVFRTSPLLMLLFIPLILRERITAYQAVALFLGFAGILVAVGGGTLNIFSGANTFIISMLVLVAAASAVAGLLIKRYVFNMESSMFIFSVANLAFFSIMFASSGMQLSPLSALQAVGIAYTGIVYNVFVGFMYYGALRMHKTTFVTNVYFLSPFITFIFSVLILGEVIEPYYILIAVLVSAGILIQKLDKHGGSYRSPSKTKLTVFDITGAFASTGELAISRAIDNGHRVFAVKLDGRHKGDLDSMIAEGSYNNIYMGGDPRIVNESTFCRDIIGARDGEHMVLKVGDVKSNEEFFSDLGSRIEY